MPGEKLGPLWNSDHNTMHQADPLLYTYPVYLAPSSTEENPQFTGISLCTLHTVQIQRKDRRH